jgi:hypothetical protein
MGMVKDKVVTVHAMKACNGRRITALIFNPVTRWCVVSFTPRPLNAGNEPWYSLNRRLGGTQSRPGHFGDGKNLELFPRFETRTHKK